MIQQSSKYWLGTNKVQNLINLRTALTNFSRIITGENYTVGFENELRSKTAKQDEKHIVVSGQVSQDNIDEVVGIALMETGLKQYSKIKFGTVAYKHRLATIHHYPPFIQMLYWYIEQQRINNIIKHNAPGYSSYLGAYDVFFDENLNTRPSNLSNPNESTYLYWLINRKEWLKSDILLPKLGEACKELDEIIEDAMSLSSTPEESLDGAEFIYDILKTVMEEDPYTDVEWRYNLKQILSGNSEKKEVDDDIKQDVEMASQMGVSYSQFDGIDNDFGDEPLDIFDIKVTQPGGEFFSYNSLTSQRKQDIVKGVSLGKKLTKRLLVRNDETPTTQNYKLGGLLDTKRLPFYTEDKRLFQIQDITTSTQYKVHLSVDISGSMSGAKGSEAIAMMVALAYCSKKIKGFDLEITLRTSTIDLRSNREKVFLFRVFDSKTKWDSFVKIAQSVEFSGGTPEGILIDHIGKTLGPQDTLLILTDGTPASHNFKGESLRDFTKKVMKSLNKRDINAYAYFIGEGIGYDKELRLFQEIYGKNGHFIDAKTTNKIIRKISSILIEGL